MHLIDLSTPLACDNRKMPTIRTIAAPLSHEADKIKGSRFIAHLAPVETAASASDFVERARAEFAGATHNCFAWRITERDDGFRYSDAGEPSGSAGRPMFDEIVGRGLVRVAAVVTRYFGGTKLGKGGLMRAYSGAVRFALDRAEILEIPITRSIELHFAYPLTGAVEAVLNAHRLEPSSATYGADVRMLVAVPIEVFDSLVDELGERGAGRVEVIPGRCATG